EERPADPRDRLGRSAQRLGRRALARAGSRPRRVRPAARARAAAGRDRRGPRRAARGDRGAAGSLPPGRRARRAGPARIPASAPGTAALLDRAVGAAAVKASAPGKVLLLGEHAVVYGHPALAAALSRRVIVEVEEDPAGPSIELLAPSPTPSSTSTSAIPVPPELLRAVRDLALAAGAPPRFRARVRSELPLGGGLGSSAALGVALARAFAQLAGRDCAAERAEELALQLERVFHGAPSGADPAICARGGVILFRRGEPARVERIPLRRPLHLAVALTGVVRGTRSTVLPLSGRRAERRDLYDPMLGFLGEL